MHEITQQYQREIDKYNLFRQKTESLLQDLLMHSNINFHKIESRCKSLESLEKKVLRKDDKYSSISDITDIVGIRIITYFEDDVDTITSIIDREFNIDSENTIDKRLHNSNEFGYKSMHLVVSLNADKTDSIEYQLYNNIKCEIQVRSLLQHTWAEIEHDLGYKSELEVPSHLRRRFSRVAALLEVADIEFASIKKELSKYKKSTDNYIANNDIQDIEINATTLFSFINQNSIIDNIEKSISRNIGVQHFDNPDSYIIQIWIIRLTSLGIFTIKELESLLWQYSDLVISFATKWFNYYVFGRDTIIRGLSILYLTYVLIANRRDEDIKFHLDRFKISNSEEYTKKIKLIYQEIINEQRK